jgi:hypothetical protein
MDEPRLDLGPDEDVPEREGVPAPQDHVAAHLAKADRRPPDTLWRPNPREQGLLGLTDAIAFFGSRGWPVSVPLIDSQPYDLIVDDGDTLHRVQVKTTTCRSRSGAFIVTLCTSGGNQSFHTKKEFDPCTADLLYVLTDDRSRYLVPVTVITTKTSITLSARMASYRVEGP